MSSASATPATAAIGEHSAEGTTLTVVVPVYNGGPEIADNVAVIRRAVVAELGEEHVELVVVSDGSIDGTAERLLASRAPGTRVIHYDRNLGKGYAVKVGALAGHGEWFAFVDADLDIDPASIPAYLAHAREHELDFAIGSKRHADSIVEYPRSRRIASWYYQQLNRLLFRLDVRDTQVGLKVFSRQVVDDVVPLLLVKRFAFDLELLAVAAALGYDRMHELPVTLEYRFSGSELRSRAVVRALLDTLAIFYRLRILRTYQRKQRLFRRVFAVSPAAQPLVSVIGDPSAVEQLDYPRLALASSVDSAEGELIALIRANAQPAGNWLTAAVPFFADPDVAAVVSPTLTPLRATVRERAAAAVLESRLGGASRRSRYFPGNVRTITDVPAESIVVRRGDLLAARAQQVDDGQLVAWLAEGGRRTIYTPDTSIAAAPPGLLRPHLTSTYLHARARGRAARRSRGASTSAATTLSLAPAAAALVGVVLIAVGSGAVRDLGIALLAAYAALVLLSMGLAAVRFRSLQVGLLAIPALIATQAVYVAGFVRGGLQKHD
jgi:glycosyltransferase involved in cell wall biosynthesis